MDRSIKVSIDPMGNVKIEADGFAGGNCADATKPIEQALSGGSGMERTLKPEWNMTEGSEQEQEHQTW